MIIDRLFSIGIILQARDCYNVILLIKKFRTIFPKQEIVVFYSGSKSSFFEELENTIHNENCILLYEENNCNIGHARNSIVSQVKNQWILMCDGDIILPDDFGKNLIGLFEEVLLYDKKAVFIQSFVDVLENSSVWAKFDFLNDTIAYLSDRTKIDQWFNLNNFNIPNFKELNTIQGVCTLFNRLSYKEVGGSDEISAGVDRSLAVKLKESGYKIYFVKSFRVLHIYPAKLSSIIKRKFWHSAGSLYIRRKFPRYYKDSLLIRLKMLKSAFCPPCIFRTVKGRIYYFLQMITFIYGLYYHQFFNKGSIDKRKVSINY